jgi:CRISPR-associated endonuclease/helicase Cas3
MSFPSFTEFFHALWGYEPFPWQARLAESVAAGKWPAYLAVPTGSGKTSCLDIAVYGLAAQANLPPEQRTIGRRIFFIVNRRVIVDEAYERARIIAERLVDSNNPSPVLRMIAERLRSLSPDNDNPPLDCVQLRGAIYRDNRWARSLTQPTIVASTVDQTGSRLLFRGYGLSKGSSPLHAALVANDSLLLLDEAHISRPFAQTLDYIRRYRTLTANQTSFATPFHFVQMTATPPKEAGDILSLDDQDYSHPILNRRIHAKKPARLYLANNVKGKKAINQIALTLVENAKAVLKEYNPHSLAIMVNRVATAREVMNLVQSQITETRATLMIGGMRPIDRDNETAIVSKELKTGATDSPNSSTTPRIVVATQCLEVGADLDFDALVTECASLDALRQRFGRLNRSGREIPAPAVIVMRGDLLESPLDPIYGEAITHTWHWLESVANSEQTVDFSIQSINSLLAAFSEEERQEFLRKVSSPTLDAPVLFPAYLDAWSQTNPRPTPDPDPALFLHGPCNATADVQVCWRRDLPQTEDIDQWVQTVSLCPPSSPETLQVPLWLFQDWLFKSSNSSMEQSDTDSMLLSPDAAANKESQPRIPALLWRGLDESSLIQKPQQIRPGDTIVLSVDSGGWSQLGYIPNAPIDPASPEAQTIPNPTELHTVDLGDIAFRQSRDREILRLRANHFPVPEENDTAKAFHEWLQNPDVSWLKSDILKSLDALSKCEKISNEIRNAMRNLIDKDFDYTRYADGMGVVFTSRRRLNRVKTSLLPLSDENDLLSRSNQDQPITLTEHTNHVLQYLKASLEHLPLSACRDALLTAAKLHDWGKLDERFQALLMRGDMNAAASLQSPIAKSAGLASTAKERAISQARSGLPTGFRHEMLSLQLATTEQGQKYLPEDSDMSTLALHLIATHHGYARPFAPVIEDFSPPSVESFKMEDAQTPTLSTEQRLTIPPHRIDSGIAERFWTLNRQYGWWGLAYLEAALRLADQQASEAESRNAT